MRALCRLDDIPKNGSRGFGPAPGGLVGLFAVRRGGRVFVYVNSCPHVGTPLDWTPDQFLTRDGGRIVCATHGAEFAIEDGTCLHGPCLGAKLESVIIEISGEVVFVPEDAGL